MVLLQPAKFHEIKAYNHSASRAAGDAFKVKALALRYSKYKYLIRRIAGVYANYYL